MKLLRARTTGACLLIAWQALTPAGAQTSPADVPLTLGRAIERALASNPELAGFAYALKAQDARRTAAGQVPAMAVSVELENVLGSGEFSGLDAAEATIALSQVIELGGKRASRGAAAQAGLELIAVERQAAQLDVLAEVSRRFLAVAAAEEQAGLAREGVALARAAADDVARRVRAARSPEAELLRARAALSRAGLDEQRAAAALGGQRQRLAAMWGSPRADFTTVRADPYRAPELLDFETLAARLDANPDFLRFASAARLRDAELRVARSLGKPDIELSGGVRRFEEPGDQALVFGISVPLFAGRRAAPNLAEADALRALADVERDAARVQARTQLFDFYQQLRQASRETEILRGEALPQLEEALEATRYAYERGRYGYLELVDAQREFLDARAAAIDSAFRARELLIEIERLTGEPLTSGPLTGEPADHTLEAP